MWLLIRKGLGNFELRAICDRIGTSKIFGLGAIYSIIGEDVEISTSKLYYIGGRLETI